VPDPCCCARPPLPSASLPSLRAATGKSYAAWRGHDQDALAAYDTLIRAFPEDFRGYLAKGMFLRDRGRQGDAERMFLQAKFYAPDSMRGFVAARAGERAAVELPDNGLE
jgi:tetratricopeptide (TPR) repeat protein